MLLGGESFQNQVSAHFSLNKTALKINIGSETTTDNVVHVGLDGSTIASR